MLPPDPRAIATAFGLGAADTLERAGGNTNDTWKLTTSVGAYFVKLVRRDEPDWWRASAERAMSWESRARDAGMPFPRPVEPRIAEFGFIARVDGGLFRTYEWIDGRPLDASDDVADWLGTTLAHMHALEPTDAIDRWVYGLHPLSDWEGWLEEGRAKQCAWVPRLAENLDHIAACLRWIQDALDSAGGFVLTHRDVEPWNVLVTSDGPVLVDLDGAGPDCAVLELAHAALVFALRAGDEPDASALRRTVRAYVDAGGTPPPPGRAALARRIGMKLNRLAWLIFITLGHRPAYQDDIRSLERSAAASLEELPHLLRRLDSWADSLARP